ATPRGVRRAGPFRRRHVAGRGLPARARAVPATGRRRAPRLGRSPPRAARGRPERRALGRRRPPQGRASLGQAARHRPRRRLDGARARDHAGGGLGTTPAPGNDLAGWTRRLAEQRLAPVRPHLQAHDGLPAVRRLIVLPAGWLAGIPVEALTDEYAVSYAP